MIRFAENLNKMITAGLGGAMEAPSTEVAVGHHIRYLESSGAVASFETNIVARIRSLRVDMQPIQAGSGDPSPENIRPITGRDEVTVWREASYDPSADPALTIQLGQTVYGGTVDVTTGRMTATWAMVDATTLNWTKGSGNPNGTFFSAFANVPFIGWTDGGIKYAMSNVFRKASVAINVASELNNTFWWNSARTGFRCVWGAPNNGSTVAELLEFLQQNNVVFVGKLATPVEIDLDPQQITTLIGYNNVWSDAGDVTLEYPYYEETEGY